MITHITVEDAAKLISRLTNANETQALTYIREAADRGEIQAADVAPVRHGRWDENGRCTLCGGHAPFWAMASTYYKSPWCHECGARMDKEDKHEAD